MATRQVNGAAVRALREALGIKQSDLATRAAISAPYLSNIEAGRKPAGPPLRRRLANALGVSLDAITSAIPDEDAA
ncbi:MAG: helix-turn-helix domain-containing protein [Streptosporangiales bacterium]